MINNLLVTRLCVAQFVYVITWARGRLRINFSCTFKVFTKLPELRSDGAKLRKL